MTSPRWFEISGEVEGIVMSYVRKDCEWRALREENVPIHK
jgi:hypothetical protein